jgi:hypothetical protein
MSVLKSIFHRYNKTAKDYDTLHPETEHAQVTDFGQGVIAHLASNVLASTISSITSDSLMAKLVKLVFNATGVQYNIAQNGYVKFGDLFGGLIIQWGSAISKNEYHETHFPISFPTNIFSVSYIPLDVNNNMVYRVSYSDLTASGINLVTTSAADIFVRYIAIGY